MELTSKTSYSLCICMCCCYYMLIVFSVFEFSIWVLNSRGFLFAGLLSNNKVSKGSDLREKDASIAQSLNNENKSCLKTDPTNLIFLQFVLEIEQAKKKKKVKLPESKSVSVTYYCNDYGKQQNRERRRMKSSC